MGAASRAIGSEAAPSDEVRVTPQEVVMPRTVEELESEALELPRPERARLAEALLSSLDEDAEVERAWREEIARRLEELRNGSVSTLPADEVFRQLVELIE